MISDLPSQAAQLATSAASRLLDAFRPSTKRQYARSWLDYQAFKLAAGLPLYQVDIHILLAFMEFLVQNGLSQPTIANYMAAIRSYHIIYNLPTAPFTDQSIQLNPFNPIKRSPLTIELLLQIVQKCQSLPFSIVFTPLYLLTFFSFLRISNILPHSTTSFDKTRQLARGDIILGSEGAVVLVKLSKTIQNRRDVAMVSIPTLGLSPLCPITALRTMLTKIPGSDNDPLFLVPKTKGLTPLTDSVARKHLKDVCRLLHLSNPITFHDFRRGGAAWAFQNGVSLEHIMKHGTWRSDAVWSYLSAAPTLHSPVSLAFRAALHS